MNLASAFETRPDLRSLRFRWRFFLVIMCPALAWLRLILPLAVLRKRLAAPRCDFAFFPTCKLLLLARHEARALVHADSGSFTSPSSFAAFIFSMTAFLGARI